MINEPIKITPPRLAQAAVSPEEPHTSIFPTIGRYKPEVSIFDDFYYHVNDPEYDSDDWDEEVYYEDLQKWMELQAQIKE